MAATRSPRNHNISLIVKALLNIGEHTQHDLAATLDLSDSAMSRKLSAGRWEVDDIDDLARFFRCPISTFFLDPAELFGSGPTGQENPRNRWFVESGRAGHAALVTT